MKRENLETRVGYRAMSVIKDELEAYVRRHTYNGRYHGDVDYLHQLKEAIAYLRDDKKVKR